MTLLHRLSAQIHRVMTSEKSDFYRIHFSEFFSHRPSDSFPESIQDWEQLPILERTEFEGGDWCSRLYCEQEDVVWLVPTSGTSGRGLLLGIRGEDWGDVHRFSGLGVRKVFAFHRLIDGLSGARSPITLYGDTENLSASADLAQSEQVDSLFGSPSTLLAFAPLLQDRDVTKEIRIIMLANERRTALQSRALKSAYPNAQIIEEPGASELWGSFGKSKPSRDDEVLRRVIARKGVYVEVVDSSGRSVKPNERGRLLVTALDLVHPFPLIRYAVGDEALLFGSEDGSAVFEILGREGEGVIRAFGCVIEERAIEMALISLRESRIEDFRAIVGEVESSNGPKGTLRIQLIGSVQPQSWEIEAIKTRLAASLRVSARASYQEAVALGRFEPIECEWVRTGKSKERRLIDKRPSVIDSATLMTKKKNKIGSQWVLILCCAIVVMGTFWFITSSVDQADSFESALRQSRPVRRQQTPWLA